MDLSTNRAVVRERLVFKPGAWRHPLRMTVAAAVAFAISKATHLPQEYWAVFTAVLVTRPDLGAAIHASTGRLIGTLFGAGLAALIALGRYWNIPELIILVATLAPLGCLIAWRSEFSAAPIAAVLVLSVGSLGSTLFAVAGLRLLDIALGAGVGVVVSWWVLPTPAVRRCDFLAAQLLKRLGQVIQYSLRDDASAAGMLRGLQDECRRDILSLAAIGRSRLWSRADRERIGMLTMRMSRLYSDVTFLVRLISEARAISNALLENQKAQGIAERLIERTRLIAETLGRRPGPTLPATATIGVSDTIGASGQKFDLIVQFQFLDYELRSLSSIAGIASFHQSTAHRHEN